MRHAPQVPVEHGGDVAHTRQQLNAVVYTDEAIVARVRRQIVLLHHIHARRRHRHTVAEQSLEKRTKIWALILTTAAGPDAANVEVALKALVFPLHITAKNFFAQVVLRAARKEVLALKPAVGRATGAWSIQLYTYHTAMKISETLCNMYATAKLRAQNPPTILVWNFVRPSSMGKLRMRPRVSSIGSSDMQQHVGMVIP
jgi:hypothetical protein